MVKETIFSNGNLNDFSNFLTMEEKSRATVEKYVRDVKTLFNFMSDKEFTKENILAYKNYLMENYAVSSVNSMLISVNQFFKFLELPEYRVKLMRRQRKLFSSDGQELTKSEYIKLLEVSSEKKYQRINLVIQTICSTGIRISELKYFTVQSLQRGKIEIYNKGKSRVIFIPKQMKLKLKKYVRRQRIMNGPIFITKNSKPIDRSNIWREMKKLCRIAGVAEEKVFPHNLRHLFARTYYKIEKDIMKLADILGHSSIETTRIYTMSTGEEHEKQISGLGLVT